MEDSLTASEAEKQKWTQMFSEPRLLYIFFMGFASGLPLILVGSTLQAWYTVSHVSIVTIGVLSLIGQPYVYKFLWAPLVDRYKLPWLSRRRSWIFALQVLLVIGIAWMGTMQPDAAPMGLAILALFIAFFSATQDIAIDAYRTEILDSKERGLGAGLFTMGYRIAMLMAGAIALVIADHMGWKFTYWLMAFLMSLQLLVTYFSKESPVEEQTLPSNLLRAIVDPFKDFFNEKYAVAVLLFIVIYKLGDVFTLILGTAFLIRGVGFSLTDIGLMYKLVGMLGIFVGVTAGGLWMQKLPLLRALLIFGIIQALTNLPFLALAIVGKNYWLLVATVFFENLGSGLGAVAFMAFIMSLCDHRYTATQFALFSALAAVGRVFVGPIAGIMVEHIGWVQYYFWAFVMGIPGILMLGYIKNHPVFQGVLRK